MEPTLSRAESTFRYGREIDQRGSVGVLNAVPQVTFSSGTTGNTPDATAYKIPQTGINTSADQETSIRQSTSCLAASDSCRKVM